MAALESIQVCAWEQGMDVDRSRGSEDGRKAGNKPRGWKTMKAHKCRFIVLLEHSNRLQLITLAREQQFSLSSNDGEMATALLQQIQD